MHFFWWNMSCLSAHNTHTTIYEKKGAVLYIAVHHLSHFAVFYHFWSYILFVSFCSVLLGGFAKTNPSTMSGCDYDGYECWSAIKTFSDRRIARGKGLLNYSVLNFLDIWSIKFLQSKHFVHTFAIDQIL